MQNFDILWGGKWDHNESENRTLNAIWTLIVGRNKDFPDMFRRLIQRVHSTVTVGCTIAYMRLI